MTTPTRPILRYHGSKWRGAPWVLSFFPPHRVYVEPFGGGGALLLRKSPAFGEIYNDLDGQVVNVFRVLRDPVTAERLRRLCELTPFARSEFDLCYEPSDDPVEAARRLLFRTWAGFGSSGIREARTGFRMEAWESPAAWINWPAQISAFTERLRGVLIDNRDALDLIPAVDGPDVLFYCDPPYVHSTRRASLGSAGTHYREEMDDDAHTRLAAVLHAAQGMVILSGYSSPLYDSLYGDWTRQGKRWFAAGARGGVLRTEWLWLNEAAASQVSQTALAL